MIDQAEAKNTRQAFHAGLDARMIAVAALMPGWTFAPDDDPGEAYHYWITMVHDSGLRISVNRFKDGYSAGAKYRFKVRADWGKDGSGHAMSLRDSGLIPYGEVEPSITIGEDQSDKAFANAIVNRLVDREGLFGYFEKIQGVIDSRAKYEAGKVSTGEELAKILDLFPGAGDRPTFRLYGYAPGVSFGEIEVSSEDCVKFELTVNAETAKTMVAALVALKEG